MVHWIAENGASVVVGAVLVLIVAGILYGRLKARRAGKSTCGCGCDGCPMSGTCRGKE